MHISYYSRTKPDQLVAMYVPAAYPAWLHNRNHFITPDSTCLQVGFIHRTTNAHFPVHNHLNIEHTVQGCAECLIVQRGRLHALIYDTDMMLVAELELSTGDVFIQFVGGHEFRVLEDMQLIEVKQGPYHPEHKQRFPFNPLNHEQSK